jgi:hypothetical protein
MRAHRIPSALTKTSHRGIFAILLSCLAFAGCGDSCVTGAINPGGGTVAGTGNSCPVQQQTGNVTLQLNSSVTGTAPSWPSDVQHIFLSLRGIEALPTDAFEDGSPEWQVLAPDLATQPVQVDLMARGTSSCGPSAFPEAIVEAGVYSQVRLRLVSNQPDASEPVPGENACGEIGFNCVVAKNGAMHPLASNDRAEIRIPQGGTVGGFFRILPDDHVRLAIIFEPRASFILPAGDASQLLPTFSVTQQSSCESDRQ